MTYVATRAVPREVLAPRARRGAVRDRRPEHVRDGALARAAHRPAQAPWRRRPVPRARVGELRHHRGRLHRLPRPLGRRVVRAGRAGRAPAPEPLPLHRLRDGRLEPAARDAPRLGRPARRVPLMGGRPRADARSSRRSGAASRSTCSTSSPTRTSSCSRAGSRASRERQVAVPGPRRRSRTPSSTRSTSSGASATPRSSSRTSSRRASPCSTGRAASGKSSLLLAAVARTLRELPEEPVVVVFSSWSDAPGARARGGARRRRRHRGRRRCSTSPSARRPSATST